MSRTRPPVGQRVSEGSEKVAFGEDFEILGRPVGFLNLG